MLPKDTPLLVKYHKKKKAFERLYNLLTRESEESN
jgi:hypothetical protein